MSPPRPEMLAFLQDIKQHPGDDTPRLIFADWLEEHGDPRGEFVRLQCELARLPPKSASAVRLEQRASDLLRANRETWLGPLEQGRMPDFHLGNFLTCQRGLIQVTFNLLHFRRETWPALAQWVGFEQTAWVEAALSCLQVSSDNLLFMMQSPLLAILGELCLKYASSGQAVNPARCLASCPQLQTLLVLQLVDYQIADADLVELARSPYLHHLKKLDLLDNSIHGQGLMSLKEFAELEYLQLSRNQLADAGLVALSAVSFKKLSHLKLDFNRIGDRGISALANSPALRTLETLTANGNLIGSDGASALAASSELSKLRYLDLSNNRIGAKGAVALASSQQLGRLQQLDVSGNSIPAARTELLQQRFGAALRV